MIKYLLLFLLPLSLYSSKVLSYNIYERTDRADVMITFDTPFSGVIKQSTGKNRITIKLEGASIETSKIKKVNSEYLRSLVITPLKDKIQIVASVSETTKLIASKTSDSYGLRLRFTKKVLTKSQNNLLEKGETDLSSLPTKKDNEMSTSYYIVVAILILGIIILLVLKKRMVQTNPTQAKSNSWLFNSNDQVPVVKAETQQTTQPLNDINNLTNNVSIRFQKSINEANSVVMLDFGEESYLVLMGNSNILLDKFKDNKPTTEQEFNTILQDRNRELKDFLGSSSSTNNTTDIKEPLQAYKERAASLIYSDES
ncbi:MAG: hypothetical protein U9O86_06235 [Campylobacterota bacterium]|nr:hypothetical protein [Campylobacterota bacterium]